MNGDWSEWSAWSTCSPDCEQTRRRTCDRPAPSGGGHYCFGLDHEKTECGGGACPRETGGSGVWMEPSLAAAAGEEDGPADRVEAPAAAAGGQGSHEVALYVGLSLAVLVFLLVVLVAASLVRRRRLPHGYTLSQSGNY